MHSTGSSSDLIFSPFFSNCVPLCGPRGYLRLLIKSQQVGIISCSLAVYFPANPSPRVNTKRSNALNAKRTRTSSGRVSDAKCGRRKRRTRMDWRWDWPGFRAGRVGAPYGHWGWWFVASPCYTYLPRKNTYDHYQNFRPCIHGPP